MSGTPTTSYLTEEDILQIAGFALPPSVSVRDIEQLRSAVVTPQSTAFGEDAYPSLWEKAAALMRAISIGHPLSDGNKRLSWLCMDAFLSLNGVDFQYDDEDTAYNLVIAVTTGELSEVPEIAKRLRALAE